VAMNNSGQIVGETNDFYNNPELYTLGTGFTDLTPILGPAAITGINDSGQIVGVFSTSPNDAFVYTPGSPPLDLGISGTAPTCINDSGEYGILSGGSLFVGSSGSYTNLGDFDPYSYGLYQKVAALNNSGQAAIMGRVSESQFVAYLYTPGMGFTNLGSVTPGGSATPEGINSSGWVVGNSSFDGYGNGAGFLYTPATGMINISVNSLSDAHSVNDSGQVVGNAGGASPHAIIYTMATGMVDLNTLVSAPGWTLEDAIAINNAGQIVGEGSSPSGYHSFLLIPILKFTSESVNSGRFVATLSGLAAGQTVIFQISTNLVNWMPVSTNTATGGSLSFTNQITQLNGGVFFRAALH
jgi:probable HAF family extracellular repeat protein